MITDPVADPADLTLSAASAALRAGALGAVEYLHALLARIDLTEPAHHTFAWIDRERAYEEAKAADQARSGNAGTPVLHGVPVGIKDLIDVKGMPSAAGCVGLAERVPTRDASVVTQLRGQGAIVLGKNTTHELGLGFDDPGTRNAWDSTRYPGGSTAGGAVSVALGSVPAAIGTDAGGSVRKPAALNGVVGFKPTHEAISMTGVAPSSRTLDHIGLITRDATDCALLWKALGGGVDATQPMRLGWVDPPENTLHPDVAHASAQFRHALVEANLELVHLDVPGLFEHHDAHTLLSRAGLSGWFPPDQRLRHHPDVLAFLNAGQVVSAHELAWARRSQDTLRHAIEQAMRRSGCDLIVLPAVAQPAMSMNDFDPGRHLSRYTLLTHPFNLTGQPAVSLPINRGGSPMPVGIQIVGRTGQDATVIGAAVTLQARGLTCFETPATPLGRLTGQNLQPAANARKAGAS